VLWAVMVEAIVLGSLLAAQAHTRGYRISKVFCLICGRVAGLALESQGGRACSQKGWNQPFS